MRLIRHRDLDQLIALVSSGRLEVGPSISGHVPLAEAADAVARLERNFGDVIRLVLVP